jgi:hypothetical protein
LFSFFISARDSKAGLIVVLIFFSCLAFLKNSIATLLVYEFLSNAITCPSSGKAKDIDKALRPVKVPISKIFLA